MVDCRLIYSLTNFLYMNSINRIEADATSTPAPKPLAKGLSKLATATAMFAGLATAACGETPEKECHEPANIDYLSTATTIAPDGTNYDISFKREEDPVCYSDTAEDPFWTALEVSTSGTMTVIPNRDSKKVDPLAPTDLTPRSGVLFAQDYYTQAVRLDADIGEFDTLFFSLANSPELEDGEKESEVVEGFRVCLLSKNPGDYNDNDYQKKAASVVIGCTDVEVQ